MGRRLGTITGALVTLAILTSPASALPFGVQIYSCTKPGVIAPAFDDGPGVYSADILDRYYAHSISLLNRRRQVRSHANVIYPGWKSRASKRHGSLMERTGAAYTITMRRYAGWWIWGIRLGRIRKKPPYNTSSFRQLVTHVQKSTQLIERQSRWSHVDLSALSPTAIRSEMTLLEDAMLDILGFFPYYMRPPLLSVNSQALRVLQELEYHVIIGDLNTKDWKYQAKETVGEAKRLFVEGLERGESIVEAHDQELWTQGELIDYMIAVVRERGVKSKSSTPPLCICPLADGNPVAVTVAECLGEPSPSQWYRTARLPYPLTRSKLSCQTPFAKCDTAEDSIPWERITPDLTCGNEKKGKGKGYICRTGQCCSRHGNCGVTEDYCKMEKGCQEEFGVCKG